MNRRPNSPSVPMHYGPAWYGEPVTIRPTWRQGEAIRQLCRTTGMSPADAITEALTIGLPQLLEEVTRVPSVGTHPVHRREVRYGD